MNSRLTITGTIIPTRHSGRIQAACLLLNLWLLTTGAPGLRAQLAITEVLPSATTNCTVSPDKHPDFWELTNYGTNTINLTGYRWSDTDNFAGAPVLANRLPIGPGESIIFVRNNSAAVPDAAAFRQWWWGNATGGPPAEIAFYAIPGLDQTGETLYLWDDQGTLIDRLEYPAVPEYSGISLIADPLGGAIGVRSEINISGAFRSTCGDIGSPGLRPDPVPLLITKDPQDTTNDVGSSITLRVGVTGLPKPVSYQWYFNGSPIAGGGGVPKSFASVINFAGSGLAWEVVGGYGDLTLASIQPSQAGDYFVVVGNGLESQTSAVATLRVNTNAIAPRIEDPPGVTWFPTVDGSRETNIVVFHSQRATLDVFARGYPPPTFQWSRSPDGTDFVDLPDGTNALLVIKNVLESDAGTYRVRVENIHGIAYGYARVTLAAKPQLRITEAMPLPCEFSRNDWWELTNIGREPVNLAGYRWDDDSARLGGGATITNAVVIEPGESIIFLESQTPESFREWWGEENLPAQLKFIRYRANGLTETGDQINLWHYSTETQDSAQKIHEVTFSVARVGTTYWFDEHCKWFYIGQLSTTGSCGTFSARNGCDVGSPGWTRFTPPAFSKIRHIPSGVHLEWKAQPGSTNVVQYASTLNGGNGWSTLGTFTFGTVLGRTVDTTVGATGSRFYRVLRFSEADCPCPEEK